MVTGRRRFRPIVLGLIASLLPALPAAAQDADRRPVTETARVVVVEIPVNVIGKDGQPVRGLTKDAFELTDDGKKVEISGFDVIDLNAPSPKKAESPFGDAPPPAARRHFLLIFDLSYSSPKGISRARQGAKAFVETGLKEHDFASVATYNIEGGWKLLVNFTNDRRQLARAVETLGFPGIGISAGDPLAFAYIPPASDVITRGGSEGEAGRTEASGEFEQQMRDLERMQKTASDDLARGRVAELLRSFEVMGRALDSVRGRKHVLYFSEGFESRLVAGDAMQRGSSGSNLEQDAPSSPSASESSVTGEVWKIDSDSRFGSSATRGRLSNALSVFNRSDAVVHTIDITGLAAEGDVVDKKGSGKDALFTIASETGGEFIRNANHLQAELESLQQKTGVTYLLAYQPKKLDKPGQFHQLKVKVKASGARVASRSGYYEPKAYRTLSPIERVLATGDLVTGGAARQEIPMHLLAAPFATDGKLAQVPVILEIPGAALIAGNTDNLAPVEIYSYASDAKGTLTDFLTQTLSLDLSKVRTTLEAGGIKYYGTLYLPTGQYTVRTLVRNGSTGRTGVQVTSLEVPAMPGGAPVVLPPVFGEAPGRWVMVKGIPRKGTVPPSADYPFAVGGESLIPAVLPTFANGQETRVALFTYNFGSGAKPEPLQVRAEIVGPDGSARPAPLKVAMQSDVERGGGRKLLYAFKPEGLAAGRYALKVAVSDPTGQRKSESLSAFEIQ